MLLEEYSSSTRIPGGQPRAPVAPYLWLLHCVETEWRLETGGVPCQTFLRARSLAPLLWFIRNAKHTLLHTLSLFSLAAEKCVCPTRVLFLCLVLLAVVHDPYSSLR